MPEDRRSKLLGRQTQRTRALARMRDVTWRERYLAGVNLGQRRAERRLQARRHLIHRHSGLQLQTIHTHTHPYPLAAAQVTSNRELRAQEGEKASILVVAAGHQDSV